MTNLREIQPQGLRTEFAEFEDIAVQPHANKFNSAVMLAVSCDARVDSRFDPTSVVALLELELLSGSVLRRLNT